MNSTEDESTRATTTWHVVLLGAMGVGKTTIGRALAAELDRPFFDSDEWLVATTGQDGRSLATAEGVVALHQWEAQMVLDTLATSAPGVVAAAASVVDSPAAAAALKPHACVWLRAPEAVTRVRRNAGRHRRSIAPDERTRIARREAMYLALSGLHIDTDVTEVAAAVVEIVEWLRSRTAVAR
jgi:shikimate kinase